MIDDMRMNPKALSLECTVSRGWAKKSGTEKGMRNGERERAPKSDSFFSEKTL
jgi:hypothetical protein